MSTRGGARRRETTHLEKFMLLSIPTFEDLARHPTVGASFEGFAITAVVDRLRARPHECFFWATHAGAEDVTPLC